MGVATKTCLFPALEKKVKFALQGTSLCFKEVCTDSGTLDVSGAGSFLFCNPVWTPGAIQHVVEVLEEHKCSNFMVLASGNTWRWVNSETRESLVMLKISAQLTQPLRSVFAGFPGGKGDVKGDHRQRFNTLPGLGPI